MIETSNCCNASMTANSKKWSEIGTLSLLLLIKKMLIYVYKIIGLLHIILLPKTKQINTYKLKIETSNCCNASMTANRKKWSGNGILLLLLLIKKMLINIYKIVGLLHINQCL